MNLRKDHYWRETICPKRTTVTVGYLACSGCRVVFPARARDGGPSAGSAGEVGRKWRCSFREALVSWGWRPRRRFKESRRPRGRVPPPGYFFFFFYHSHMLKKPTCRKLPRPQCLCVLAKLFVDDDCWKSKEKENNFRRWITRLVRR